ncbi:MAG: 3-dehydroquinate synthase [Chloroflexota bacterium]|jgi:shikimate kinase/3-dehydroquinate synthase|nr:3-dehydroquinate synthase [Chloroflexota bacterium]
MNAPEVAIADVGRIFLVGLSGSGKSTLGVLLAERLGLPFIDTDAAIERTEGASVANIFATRGEAAFRALERDAVLASCRGTSSVVATGGGAVLSDEVRDAMLHTGRVIWLDAPVEVLAGRLAGMTDRPLLADDVYSRLVALAEQRASLYAAAHLRVDAAVHPEIVMSTILRALDRLPDLNPVWVQTPSQTYPVYVGSGVLACAGALLGAHGLDAPLRIIADERVAELHGAAVREALAGFETSWYLVPAGEEHKSVAQAVELYGRLLADRPERRDVIVALGGGVIGDLAGFIAATLLRGMRFIQIPTTLLSQVDSSVGGKVGVDHPSGKNLIGAFHHPNLVLADVAVLRTLPPREVAAGWAEVVKIAVIQDRVLFDDLEAHVDEMRVLEPDITTRAIRRDVELKARIVDQDEHDLLGLRAILNYGHTLGHAIEAATGYAAYRHGEGVAIGMAGAAHIAEAMELHPAADAQRQRAVLERLGLPQHVEGATREMLRAAMGLDKKREGGRQLWVLPTGIGSVCTSKDVPEQIVDEAIALITRSSHP